MNNTLQHCTKMMDLMEINSCSLARIYNNEENEQQYILSIAILWWRITKVHVFIVNYQIYILYILMLRL